MSKEEKKDLKTSSPPSDKLDNNTAKNNQKWTEIHELKVLLLDKKLKAGGDKTHLLEELSKDEDFVQAEIFIDSIEMKLGNIENLKSDKGLSHISKLNREVFDKYKDYSLEDLEKVIKEKSAQQLNKKDQTEKTSELKQQSEGQASNSKKEAKSESGPKEEVKKEAKSESGPKEEVKKEVKSESGPKEEVKKEVKSESGPKEEVKKEVKSESGPKEEVKKEVKSESGPKEEVKKEAKSESGPKEEVKKEVESKSGPKEDKKSSKEPIKLNGLYAFKMSMTRFYNEKGESLPVTALKYEPSFVSQIKTKEKDSYSAVQIAFKAQKNKRCTRPIIQHLKKAGFKEGARFIKEVKQSLIGNVQIGDELSIQSLEKGDLVKISSVSKGKGFAGVMKRWNFAGGRASHGSKAHRRTGSIGQCTQPGRVFPGRKMPGRHGFQKVSRLKVPVVEVLPDEGVIFVKGAVPGARNTLVSLQKM